MLGWSKNYDIIEANLCILAVLIKNILKVIKKVLKSHPIHSIFHYSSWGGSRNPHFFPSSLLKNHPSCIVCIHILNVSSKKAQAYYYNCCWLCVYTIAKKSRTIQLKNAIQLSELIEAEQMKTPRTEKTSRGNCITVAKNAKFSMTIFTHWVHKKNGRALLLLVLCYMLPFCVVCLEKMGSEVHHWTR